jgi:hypothetical protein
MPDFSPDLPPQLRTLETELAEAQSRAHQLVEGLPAEDWNRRPAPQRWSIGEQIIHLNLTTHAYLPPLEEALAKARESGLTGEGPFRRGFFGWLLERLTEPPVRLRFKTSAPFIPSEVEPPAEALAEFDRLQGLLTATFRRSAGLALDRVNVVSPFDARVRYNVYFSFRILAAHQRRHLWLAERIRKEISR